MADEQEYRKWVVKALSRRMWRSIAGALACFLIGLGVLWLSWWALYFITWFTLYTLEPSAAVVLAITWITFVLLFVAYYGAYLTEPEASDMEQPPGKVRVARAAAYLTDSPFLALAGPKTAGGLVKVVSAITLVGPATLMTAWRLLMQAKSARQGPPDLVGAVLATLAHAGVRVSLDELFRIDSSDRWDAAFQAVRLFDGVILRTSEPVGLVLSESLRNEILKVAPVPARIPSAPKTAPVRVSSVKRPSSGSPVAEPKRPLGGKPSPGLKRPAPGSPPAAPKTPTKGTPPTQPKRKPRP